MRPLVNALERWLSTLTGTTDIQWAGARLDDIIRQLRSANSDTACRAAKRIAPGECLMTHSRSSAVLALFRHLADIRRPVRAIVTLSGPGNEGALVASELDALGIDTTLITDAQMGLFVGKTDRVICGCDAWLADDHFVNKAGTGLLALAAREAGTPFWVLADSFRDSPQTRATVTLEELAADELRPPPGEHIHARNIYFETVPTRLVTARVREDDLQPLAFSGPKD